jgi:NTP pyrophosphatase (non-canonical NTP hydrolase)
MENQIETPKAILGKFTDGGKNITEAKLCEAIQYAQQQTVKTLGIVQGSNDFTPNQQKAIESFTKVIGGGTPEGEAKDYLFAMASMTCFIAGRVFQQSIVKTPVKEEPLEVKSKADCLADSGFSCKNLELHQHAQLEKAMDEYAKRNLPGRPAVQWFAGEMEKKLKENDHKGGWGNMSFDELYLRMKKETQELLAADMMHKSPEAKIAEAADVANFCLMIADLHANKYGK